jgi:spore maturation protein SpmA
LLGHKNYNSSKQKEKKRNTTSPNTADICIPKILTTFLKDINIPIVKNKLKRKRLEKYLECERSAQKREIGS